MNTESPLEVIFNESCKPNLTEDESVAIRSYWECDSELKFKFRVDDIRNSLGQKPSDFLKFIRSSSSCFHTEIECLTCHARLQLHSRADVIKSHLQRNADYACDTCTEEKEQVLRERVNNLLLDRMCENASQWIELYSLGAADLISVYCLAKYHRDRNIPESSSITSINNMHPYGLYSIQSESLKLIERLEKQGNILCFNDYASPVFSITDDRVNIDFQSATFMVNWPNSVISCDVQTQQLADYLRLPSFIDDNYTAIKDLAKNVELSECLAYLDYCINSAFMQSYHCNNITRELKACLEIYSAREVFKIIWVATKQAEKEMSYKWSGCDNKEAFDSIPRNLKFYFEKSMKEPNYIELYSRPLILPRSLLSKALFEDILEDEEFFRQEKVISEVFTAGYKLGPRDKEIQYITASGETSINIDKATTFMSTDDAEQAAFERIDDAPGASKKCPVICDSQGQQMTIWVL